jgi:hypothetical protein
MHTPRMLWSATGARVEPRGRISSRCWGLCRIVQANLAKLLFHAKFARSRSGGPTPARAIQTPRRPRNDVDQVGQQDQHERPEPEVTTRERHRPWPQRGGRQASEHTREEDTGRYEEQHRRGPGKVVGDQTSDAESKRAHIGQGKEKHGPDDNASAILGALRAGCRLSHDLYFHHRRLRRGSRSARTCWASARLRLFTRLTPTVPMLHHRPRGFALLA